ncbi:MAG: N-methyl-L-tryptophan oxidase [SAR202 cluster bacterium]|nr:N-methyl-L-tryptophan oxidase [SAR202 cluster bacterium]OUU73666.1 MAG: N-methyltryptophan oxidase [Chloroflexi bacterium TMED70]RZP17530.1 MAG: N-methyl-L-tryptophan oxidase [Chloroflexota bacterium]
MKKNIYDVIIIGLGAMGSAASYYLSKNGVKVLGLDTYEPPHKLGSSHGHTRVIREAYHEGTSYVPIVKRAYELWNELDHEIEDKLILEYGGMYLGDDGKYLSDAKKSAKKYDIPIKEFSSKEIKEKYNILNPPNNFKGLLENRSGAVFPEKAISNFLSKSINNGSSHNYNEKVIGWGKQSKFYKVETDKNNYFAEKLIFSSGAWIKNLVPSLKLPVKIERQVLFWFDPIKDKDRFHYSNMPNTGWDLDNGMEFYTQPNIENKGFKVAMHHNGKFISENDLNRESNADDLSIVKNFLEEYIPLANGKLIDSRVCVYTNTPDFDFIIDFYPNDENIIICSPCSGHGFKFTPAIGEICSELVINNGTNYDLSEFSIKRLMKQ